MITAPAMPTQDTQWAKPSWIQSTFKVDYVTAVKILEAAELRLTTERDRLATAVEGMKEEAKREVLNAIAENIEEGRAKQDEAGTILAGIYATAKISPLIRHSPNK
jgi:hypothetical protein